MASVIRLHWQARLGHKLRKRDWLSVWELVDSLDTGRAEDPDVNEVFDALELLYRMGIVRRRVVSEANIHDPEYQLI